MKKLSLLTVALAVCLPLSVLAQEGPKAELFGGYSYLRINTGEGVDGIGAHGFNLSVAGNVTRNIGLVAEFSRFTKSETLNLGDLFNEPGLGAAGAKARTSTYLFGPRFTLRTGSAEPFVHALVGGARGVFEASAAGLSGKLSDSSFAYALGGGLDVKVHENIAIRLGQVDYLRTKFIDERANNLRYSVGIVFRFGNR
ncbi:MAG: outer membrane protein [Blastocatellia bacterium]